MKILHTLCIVGALAGTIMGAFSQVPDDDFNEGEWNGAPGCTGTAPTVTEHPDNDPIACQPPQAVCRATAVTPAWSSKCCFEDSNGKCRWLGYRVTCCKKDGQEVYNYRILYKAFIGPLYTSCDVVTHSCI
ncbi:hypothetical protein QPK87_09775 [Kamptonema cortianum]|nr:hypothetical protein [Geitlerinema splendidum]MDK3156863.1 hypothetical protein [Kamptonema cortianum]